MKKKKQLTKKEIEKLIREEEARREREAKIERIMEIEKDNFLYGR